jgi:uncharacterized protein YndB with AHSA1/START domain
MLQTILLVILAAVAIVLVLAALRPSTFRVERSATFKASPEKVFAAINSMKAFNEWNPWLRMDPATAGTYAGPEVGKGSAYAWESKKMGAGRMEIVESQPASRIALKLDFLKPFEATTWRSSHLHRTRVERASPGRCMDRRRSCSS